MASTLWDTTGSEVVETLLAERRAAGALASGLALTLVVVVDEKRVQEAEQAATIAAAAHPCRVLIVVRRVDRARTTRLDAEVQVGGRLGATEAVVMRMYGRLALHAESVVLPLLAPDAPVVTWWHGRAARRDRRPTPSACSRIGGSPTARRPATRSPPLRPPGRRLRPRRHRPGLDPDHPVALAAGLGARCRRAARRTAQPSPPKPGTRAPRCWPAGSARGWASPPRLSRATAPGISAAELRTTAEGGETYLVKIERPDGRSATLSRGSEQPRALPLPRRELGDLLAEELRRMDPDFVYAEALAKATGVTVAETQRPRTLIWRDPARQAAASGDISPAAS